MFACIPNDFQKICKMSFKIIFKQLAKECLKIGLNIIRNIFKINVKGTSLGFQSPFGLKALCIA